MCVYEREREQRRERTIHGPLPSSIRVRTLSNIFFSSRSFFSLVSLSRSLCEYVYVCRMNSFDEGQEKKSECTLTDLLTLFRWWWCCCCYWWRWWKHDSEGSISSRSSNGQIERTTQLAWCKINKKTASLFTCRLCRLTTEEKNEWKKKRKKP